MILKKFASSSFYISTPHLSFKTTLLLLIVFGINSNMIFANDISQKDSTAYESAYSPSNEVLPIFKFIDNHGKVTYSTEMPHDFVDAEEVDLINPPLKKNIEETKKINATLKSAADELSKAREERESLREEKEKKRLEKLTLINQSKPPVVYQPNTYVTYPYYYGRKKVHHKRNVKPEHLPARVHPPKHGPNLPGSVPHHPR